ERSHGGQTPPAAPDCAKGGDRCRTPPSRYRVRCLVPWSRGGAGGGLAMLYGCFRSQVGAPSRGVASAHLVFSSLKGACPWRWVASGLRPASTSRWLERWLAAVLPRASQPASL